MKSGSKHAFDMEADSDVIETLSESSLRACESPLLLVKL